MNFSLIHCLLILIEVSTPTWNIVSRTVYLKDQQFSTIFICKQKVYFLFILFSKCLHYTVKRWFNPLSLRISQVDVEHQQTQTLILERLWTRVFLKITSLHLLQWYRVNAALGSLWMPATLCVDSHLLHNKRDSLSYSCVVEKLNMTVQGMPLQRGTTGQLMTCGVIMWLLYDLADFGCHELELAWLQNGTIMLHLIVRGYAIAYLRWNCQATCYMCQSA
jgi:hypothetical protein